MDSQAAELRLALEAVIRCGSAEQRIVRRAWFVLLAVFEGWGHRAVALGCETSPQVVRKWIRRFVVKPGIVALLDARRSGRPKILSIRDHAVVISMACQKPDAFGRLEARMTQQLISDLALERGVSVSRSSVQRILANTETKPHRQRYYLFTAKDDPDYESRRDAICDLYTRELPENEVAVCFDEKTGMQALGSPCQGRPTRPGQVALMEHNYIRHGSRSLAAAIRVDTGEVVVGSLFPSRGYATDQAIEMLKEIAAALPTYRVIHLVWDNASTHTSKKMQEFLATSAGRQFRLYYTPKHASWLNMAENFFSRLSRRYLIGRRYESLEAFDGHVLGSLSAYNELAKPVDWRYNPAARAA